MSRKLLFTLVLLATTAVFYLEGAHVPVVLSMGAHQTIPTRTPTPPPPTATQPSNGGGTNPTATHTPAAAVTPTSTLLPVNIAPTPVGGFLPTAVPCGSSPTIQTLGATNVRSGPGLEYDVIGELVYLEVRYIVGRAETAEWWLIQFNNGQFGWVSNDIVLVQGYTPIVPIVEAPPLNGSTPTPAALWNPTPFPSCTVTPVPSNTPTAAAEIVQVEVEPTATPTSAPTEIPPTEVLPTDTPIVQPTAVPLNPTEPAETAVSPEAPEQGGSSNVLFIGLAAVVAVGLGVFFLRRR
jgi:hypothetical protein